MSDTRRTWPFLVLLAEVLIFFRHVLFYGHYAIPWDFRYYHFSLASFIARSFQVGEFPLWDPYNYCGVPFYADITTQALYPPTLITVFLSNWTGGHHLLYLLELQLIVHVLLGGILAYLLIRYLGAAPTPALVGATIYQLGAYVASQAQHLGAVDAVAWLPLAWLAVFSLAQQFRWRWFAALVFALAMSILTGFPAAAAVVFVSSLLLSVILVGLRHASKLLPVQTLVAVIWSVLVSAIQVFPTLQLSRLSVAHDRTRYLGTGGGMPLQSLVSLVLPNHYGMFQFAPGKWKLPWDPTFMYAYSGILTLVFVGLAVGFRRRNRYTLDIALLALCMGLWMLGDSTPIGKAIFATLPNPLKNSLYAQFALCGFSLGIAVLGGLGAQQILPSRRPWIRAVAIAAVATDLIAVSSGRIFNTVDETVDPGIAYDHYYRYPQIPAEIRDLVNQRVPPWRVDIMQGAEAMVTHGTLFEYPAANGNSPFALSRFMLVRLTFCDGVYWGRYYEVGNPDSPLLKFLNVRYVLSSKTLDKPGRLFKIRELPGTSVYENPGVLPRFLLVNRTRRATNLASALAILRSRNFDPATEAVVEHAAEIDSVGPTGTVRVLDYEPQAVTLQVQAAVPEFLVTSEAAYPGWRASIDGKPCSTVMTNVAFRGLPIPPGTHSVQMWFDPGVLWRSAWITVAAGLILILAVTREMINSYRVC